MNQIEPNLPATPESDCPNTQRYGPRTYQCEISKEFAREWTRVAMGSMMTDIGTKMRHAMNVHGLSRTDAVAFVVGCYVTVNAEGWMSGSLTQDGLKALKVLVGELASNA